MAVLRTPPGIVQYEDAARAIDRARVPAGARARMRLRRGIALLIYSTGYPLLALALWTGARTEDWGRTGALVALGVLMSFLGWGLLSSGSEAMSGGGAHGRGSGAPVVAVFIALYNRAGAIVVMLGSYALDARAHGWPAPETFIGWFALVWIPLFISFAVPVDCASPPRDPND